jgi:hypothetical protein
MILVIATVLLTLNAIFWGLYSHDVHCKVAAAVGVKSCPPHWVHLTIGLVSFIGAIVTSQWSYLVKT